MKTEKHISEYLKEDKIQRLIYFGILLLWLFVGLDFVKYKYDFSPFRVDMLTMIIVPTLLLAAPIVLNRKIVWIGAFGFSVFYSIWTTYKVIFNFLADLNRDYAPSSIWHLKDICISISIILILFFITWVLWKMKPLNKTTAHNN